MEIKNFFVIPAFKTIIPPMEALLSDNTLILNGFIAPGHVSAVIGAKPYEYITDKYKIPCVITGFEALDILSGHTYDRKSAFKRRGQEPRSSIGVLSGMKATLIAAAVIQEVFKPVDSNWRGIGLIPQSGLGFSRAYESFDAIKKFKSAYTLFKRTAGCRCGEVLKGAIKPDMCPLFAKKCTPDNPVGACMVSSEGSCAAYFKYGK